jgi:hypothetical protein
MTVLSLVERRVFEHIGWDEIGIEYGRGPHGRVQTTYQPIFAVGKRGLLTIAALRAGFVTGQGEASSELPTAVTASLAVRNFGHSGSEDLDLYIDQTFAGPWSAPDLLAWAKHGRDDPAWLPEPRRIFLEVPPAARHAPEPLTGPFRRALVNERPDDELDAWIVQYRPSIVRMEGKWIASLAQHPATRTLLATLAQMLNRRGIKTLFEGLDDDALVAFAHECGADFMQGDALAKPIVAGEYLNREAISPGGKVISVDFGRGRKPSSA